MDYSKSSIETPPSLSPTGGLFISRTFEGGGLIETGGLVEKGELIQFSKDDGISTP